MREKGPPEPPMEVPTWFFTYTDVITLLMTFFVLLLTFATSEPEKFERMQVALFGGGGGTGVAGKAAPLEKDSVLIRERPRSSRMTNRGSEMPPIHSDAAAESLKSGLEGLDERPTVNASDNFSFDLPISLLVDEDKQITPVGSQYLRMFARRLRKGAHDIMFQVAHSPDVERAMALAQHLAGSERVTPGLIAVSVAPGNKPTLRVVLTYNPPR